MIKKNLRKLMSKSFIISTKEYLGIRAAMHMIMLVAAQGLAMTILDDYQLQRNLKLIVRKSYRVIDVNLVSELSNHQRAENLLISIFFIVLGYLVLLHYTKVYEKYSKSENIINIIDTDNEDGGELSDTN